MTDATVQTGSVDPLLAAEFPGLELRWQAVRLASWASPGPLRRRLRALSDRYSGARVVAMRTQPIAHAYRAFYRQIGLDPDQTRIPSEAAAVSRLVHGGFRSSDRLSDALLVALVETGVPVWALDGAAVQPQTLTIRASRAGERLCEGEREGPVALAPGRLVVADAGGVRALLFAPAPGAPARRPAELILFSVGVPGVPAIFLEEALWLAAEAVEEGA